MNGKEALDVIEKVAAEGSRTQKELILSVAMEHEFFRRVVRYTYDPFITFGVTWPSKAQPVEGSQSFDGMHEAWDILQRLARRELTGSNAVNELTSLRDSLDGWSWELVRRILNKDLRAGFTENTVNRIAPGTIPKFEVMLAHKFEEKRVKGWPVAVEPKLDGLRTLGLIKNGAGKFYSRTGKEFKALEHLGPHIAKMIRNAIYQSANPRSIPDSRDAEQYFRWLGGDSANPTLAIDAEVISGSFAETSGAVRRKSESADDAVLNVFDALPLDFMLGSDREWKIAFNVRRKFLEFVVGCAETDAPIQVTPLDYALNHDEVQAIYQKHRDAKFEGAMVKPIDGTYSKKRSHAWLKLKGEETLDLPIIGAFEGTGKYAGQLGGLIVNCDGVEVRVGGGFSDHQRVEFWNAYLMDRAAADAGAGSGALICDRLIEVEFHEKTPDGSLRHPRFVRWRPDLDPKAADEAA